MNRFCRVSWTTTHEIDVRGFNVIVRNQQGERTQQNPVIIQCEECITGRGARYASFVPKHKSGKSIFIEIVRSNGVVETFGAAIRQ